MRKTREQSRLETRQRLIASAHAAIVREGIGDLSLRGLFDGAVYSQGAFYSNLSSRDDLLLALMQAHIHEEVEVLRHLIRSTRRKPLDELLAMLALCLADLAKESQWSLLAVELQLYAQRDGRFADVYNAAKNDCHAEFAMLGVSAQTAENSDAQKTRGALSRISAAARRMPPPSWRARLAPSVCR